jgi:hypothetical protein
MNEFKRIAKMLGEAQEALEMLAGGEAGMLDEGTTAGDISELIEAVQDMAGMLEDELVEGLSRAGDHEIEDMVDCWLDTASKVDARRGEVA